MAENGGDRALPLRTELPFMALAVTLWMAYGLGPHGESSMETKTSLRQFCKMTHVWFFFFPSWAFQMTSLTCVIIWGPKARDLSIRLREKLCFHACSQTWCGTAECNSGELFHSQMVGCWHVFQQPRMWWDSRSHTGPQRQFYNRNADVISGRIWTSWRLPFLKIIF